MVDERFHSDCLFVVQVLTNSQQVSEKLCRMWCSSVLSFRRMLPVLPDMVTALRSSAMTLSALLVLATPAAADRAATCGILNTLGAAEAVIAGFAAGGQLAPEEVERLEGLLGDALLDIRNQASRNRMTVSEFRLATEYLASRSQVVAFHGTGDEGEVRALVQSAKYQSLTNRLRLHASALDCEPQEASEQEDPTAEGRGNATPDRDTSGAPSRASSPMSASGEALDIRYDLFLPWVIAGVATLIVAFLWAYSLGAFDRRARRYFCQVAVTLVSLGGETGPSEMVEVSRTGAKLKLGMEIEKGNTIEIAWEGGSRKAKVVWSNAHFAGVRFSEAMRGMEVRELVRAAPVPA